MKIYVEKLVLCALAAVMFFFVMSCQPASGSDNPSKKTVAVPETVYVPKGWVEGSASNKLGVFLDGRNVVINPFYIGKYEVTQKQYSSVMQGEKVTVSGITYSLDASPSLCTGLNAEYKIDFGEDHGNHPVENVTWYDAVYYCNALSKAEKLSPCYIINVKEVVDGHITSAVVTYNRFNNGYRLPTEIEWEYAARGGDPSKDVWNYEFSGADEESNTFSPDSMFSYDTDVDSVGWYEYNNYSGVTGSNDVTDPADGKGTHEVGKKAPNALGLYDMSGNVSEWCYDYMDYSGRPITKDTPITGPEDGSQRMIRGGSWSDYASKLVVYNRKVEVGGWPHIHDVKWGFRVCRKR